jgi:transcriptional regulator with XRE-family HTH domain
VPGENRMPRPYAELGSHLSKLRKARKLTQKEVSVKLGYSSSQFISNFERGITAPPMKKMRTLIELYGLNLREVVNRIQVGQRRKLKEAFNALGH